MSFEQGSSISNLSAETKLQAVEAARPAAALMDRATVHHQGSGASASSHGDNREALMHTAGAPGKTQAALSPTDNHKGQTQTQGRQQDRGRSIDR